MRLSRYQDEPTPKPSSAFIRRADVQALDSDERYLHVVGTIIHLAHNRNRPKTYDQSVIQPDIRVNAARGQSYFRVLDDRPQLLRPPCSAGTEVGKQRQSRRLPDILKIVGMELFSPSHHPVASMTPGLSQAPTAPTRCTTVTSTIVAVVQTP